jgi:hypothetical protein
MIRKIDVRSSALPLQLAQACAAHAHSQMKGHLCMHMGAGSTDLVTKDGFGVRVVEIAMSFYLRSIGAKRIDVSAMCTIEYQREEFTRAEVVLRTFFDELNPERREFVCVFNDVGELQVVERRDETKIEATKEVASEEVSASRGRWQLLVGFFRRKRNETKKG